MDKSNLFMYEDSNFMVVAAEGNAPALIEGIEKYQKSGKYRREADFSPILWGKSPKEDFLVVNIYGKRVCTMTVFQHPSNRPNTSLVCSGNKKLPLEFLADFAEIIELEKQEPSRELITEAQASQNAFFWLYQKVSEEKGEDFAAKMISTSLKIQHQKYLSESRKNN